MTTATGAAGKRIIVIGIFLILAVNAALAQNPILAALGANYMVPSDPGYRAIYGGGAVYPDFTLGFRLYRGLYLLGSFGILAKEGKTPELGLPAQSKQNFLSIGLGYIGRTSGPWNVMVEAGAVSVSYKEEALESWASGKMPGFKAELGLLWMKEDGQIFVGLKAGYMSARVEDFDIRLGGPKVSFCIGIK